MKIFFYCVLSLLFSPSIFAKINIVTEIFPNFQYLNSEGQLIGLSTKKVEQALQSANIDYTLTVYPWSVAYNAALRDRNTCVFSLARIAAREDKFAWVAKLHGFNASFYALEGSDIALNSIEQAKAYKIAVVRDNFSHHYLKDEGFSELSNLIVIDNFDKIYDLIDTRKDIVELLVLNEEQFNFRKTVDTSLLKLQPIFRIEAVKSDLYFACHKEMDHGQLTALKAAFKRG
ncbi:hypothetical protein B1199_00200 [Pseudoalteromonas ulvae]|uniref:Amino acid ABC transporter substrate-binding protein n=1 Tax=Pseudoalteromonas ulvae TaxID=107327 RepID=A0A244CT28_PSEDV|nr:hypothetical protein B1199_00200 [Pseudoalteromonas ulvae]